MSQPACLLLMSAYCRVHALFFTDHVQSELLSEVQFPHQAIAQLLPQSTEPANRTMVTLKLVCHDLCEQMAPYADI